MRFETVFQSLGKPAITGSLFQDRSTLPFASLTAPAQDIFTRKAPRFSGSRPTEISLSKSKWKDAEADVLIVPIFQKRGEALSLQGQLAELNELMGGGLKQAIDHDRFDHKGEIFNGGYDQALIVHTRPNDGIEAKRIVLLGLGEMSRITPYKVKTLLRETLHDMLPGIRSAAIVLPDKAKNLSTMWAIEAIANSVHQSTYRSAEAHKKGLELDNVDILVPNPRPGQALYNALEEGEVLGRAVAAAKDIINSPHNKMTVKLFAQQAEDLGKKHPKSLKVTIEKSTEWLEKEMPAFYAVGKAAATGGGHPDDSPQFIKIHYKPLGGKPNKKIAIVGKSIMYDTGGVQSKGDSMNNMSKDKSGGAYAMALMQSLAELQPENVEVIAYMAATPNLQDGKSYLPDDIITAANGKKIRVNHTDAEGRLTLIDAVHMASKDEPDEIITIATLTGAAEDAVGKNVALMTSEQDYVTGRKLLMTARETGEGFEYMKVKMDHADPESDWKAISSTEDSVDLLNDTPGPRGGQKAAAFVMAGLPETVWIPLIHLDMCGVMADDEATDSGDRATGIGVETIYKYLLKQ